MKRSFSLLFFFLTVWFFTACETDSCGCVTYDLDIEVAIQDAAGNDLLNPSTDGYFSEHDIDMFYEINGKHKTYASLASGAHLDNPKGFTIIPRDSRFVLSMMSNPTAGKKVVTLLRIKDHPDIKIVTKVVNRNGEKVKEVWYNDVLVWPGTDSTTGRLVEVTID